MFDKYMRKSIQKWTKQNLWKTAKFTWSILDYLILYDVERWQMCVQGPVKELR